MVAVPTHKAANALPKRLTAFQGGPSLVLSGEEPLGAGLVFRFDWGGGSQGMATHLYSMLLACDNWTSSLWVKMESEYSFGQR